MKRICIIINWNFKKLVEITFHVIYINIPILLLRRININRNNLSHQLDLYVVAFNNFDTIQLQHEKLRLYLDDDHNYIILDNSNKKEVSKKIYTYCKENHLGYVSLPKQNMFKISASHALALNWASKNIIKKRKTSVVGLIDHDIYPFNNYSVIQFLKNKPFYGVRHFAISQKNKRMWDANTPKYWYLWPGFMFFHFNSFRNCNLNFMPMSYEGNYFDTGGVLYKTHYSKFTNLNESCFISHHWKKIDYERGVDIFDNRWVHISNVSNWRGICEKLNYSKLSNIVKSFEIT